MAYQKTNWVDGQAPPLSAQNLNKIENALEESYNGYLRAFLNEEPFSVGNETPTIIVGPPRSGHVLQRIEISIVENIGGIKYLYPAYIIIGNLAYTYKAKIGSQEWEFKNTEDANRYLLEILPKNQHVGEVYVIWYYTEF